MKIVKNSFDYIAGMSDEELHAAYGRLNHEIKRRQGESDSTEVEIEVCYIFRELEVRENRRKAHEEYLKKLS